MLHYSILDFLLEFGLNANVFVQSYRKNILSFDITILVHLFILIFCDHATVNLEFRAFQFAQYLFVCPVGFPIQFNGFLRELEDEIIQATVNATVTQEMDDKVIEHRSIKRFYIWHINRPHKYGYRTSR